MIIGPSVTLSEPPRCPHCRKKLDGAFEVGGEGRPEPGNISLCGYCGNWSIYGKNLELVKPDQKLLAMIKADRKCQVAYHATMKVIRRRNRQN